MAHELRGFLGRAGRDDLDAVASTERPLRRLPPFAAANATRVRVRDDEGRCGRADGGESSGHFSVGARAPQRDARGTARKKREARVVKVTRSATLASGCPGRIRYRPRGHAFVIWHD